MNLKKPPMGWNSYDYYDTTVNEEQVRANADYMAAHLKEYGWEYVVVDIAWYSYEAGEQRQRFQYVPFCRVEMDEYSRLLPCVKRFPSLPVAKVLVRWRLCARAWAEIRNPYYERNSTSGSISKDKNFWHR